MKTTTTHADRWLRALALFLALLVSAVSADAQAPVVDSAPVVELEFGVPFEYEIKASNEPVGYGAAGLPFWMKREGAFLRGTPVVKAEAAVTLHALNQDGLSDPKRVIFRIVGSAQVIEKTSKLASPIPAAGR